MDFLSSFLKTPTAYAYNLTPYDPGSKTVAQVIARYLTSFLFLLGTAAIAFIIYGGVLLILSQGDPEKMKKAKGTLLWAIIGTIVIVISYAIVVLLAKQTTKLL